MPSERARRLVFSARVLEWGFYLPDHGTISPVDERLKPFTSETYVQAPLAGLTEQLQFFRVCLTERGEVTTVEHLVLSAHHPQLAETVIRSLAALIRSHAPGVALSFTVEDREGWARIAPDILTPQAAAAVALVKATMGWDESDPIVIESADHAFEVEMSFADETWTAAVAATSTPARSPHH